jgi:hypothetical protein
MLRRVFSSFRLARAPRRVPGRGALTGIIITIIGAMTSPLALVDAKETLEEKNQEKKAGSGAAPERGDHNRLSAAEREAGWKLLWNGTDLAGFGKPTREARWAVKDGTLVGTGGAGVIATEAAFQDFELVFEIRVHDTGGKRGNSGVFIRSSGLTALRGRWPDGPEIQVDNGDPEHWTGAIWQTARAKKVTTRDGEWIRMRVEAKGARVRVWVNGELVTDHEGAPERAGPIAFQVHHPTNVVELRSLKLRELP